MSMIWSQLSTITRITSEIEPSVGEPSFMRCSP